MVVQHNLLPVGWYFTCRNGAARQTGSALAESLAHRRPNANEPAARDQTHIGCTE
jgi:hypothetical protein